MMEGFGVEYQVVLCEGEGVWFYWERFLFYIVYISSNEIVMIYKVCCQEGVLIVVFGSIIK